MMKNNWHCWLLLSNDEYANSKEKKSLKGKATMKIAVNVTSLKAAK